MLGSMPLEMVTPKAAHALAGGMSTGSHSRSSSQHLFSPPPPHDGLPMNPSAPTNSGSNANTQAENFETAAIDKIGELLDEIVSLASAARSLYQRGEHSSSSSVLSVMQRSIAQIGELGSRSRGELGQVQSASHTAGTAPSTVESTPDSVSAMSTSRRGHRRTDTQTTSFSSTASSPTARKRPIGDDAEEDGPLKSLRSDMGTPVMPPSAPPSAPPNLQNQRETFGLAASAPAAPPSAPPLYQPMVASSQQPQLQSLSIPSWHSHPHPHGSVSSTPSSPPSVSSQPSSYATSPSASQAPSPFNFGLAAEQLSSLGLNSSSSSPLTWSETPPAVPAARPPAVTASATVFEHSPLATQQGTPVSAASTGNSHDQTLRPTMRREALSALSSPMAGEHLSGDANSAMSQDNTMANSLSDVFSAPPSSRGSVSSVKMEGNGAGASTDQTMTHGGTIRRSSRPSQTRPAQTQLLDPDADANGQDTDIEDSGDMEHEQEQEEGIEMSERELRMHVTPELRAKIDALFLQFLEKICSDLSATDDGGEQLSITLMPKRMAKVKEEMPNFRPFKFRIQPFTNAFQSFIYKNGIDGTVECDMKRLKSYLWTNPYISRFNEDGRKNKTKGIHTWIIEGRKLNEHEWEFRKIPPTIAGPPDKTAWVGEMWQWALRIWDPHSVAAPIKAVFETLQCPPWVEICEEGRLLKGTPNEGDEGGTLMVTAIYKHADDIHRLKYSVNLNVRSRASTRGNTPDVSGNTSMSSSTSGLHERVMSDSMVMDATMQSMAAVPGQGSSRRSLPPLPQSQTIDMIMSSDETYHHEVVHPSQIPFLMSAHNLPFTPPTNMDQARGDYMGLREAVTKQQHHQAAAQQAAAENAQAQQQHAAQQMALDHAHHQLQAAQAQLNAQAQAQVAAAMASPHGLDQLQAAQMRAMIEQERQGQIASFSLSHPHGMPDSGPGPNPAHPQQLPNGNGGHTMVGGAPAPPNPIGMTGNVANHSNLTSPMALNVNPMDLNFQQVPSSQ